MTGARPCGTGHVVIAHRVEDHLAALADWVDDPTRAQPSNLEVAYAGLEILSGLERRRMALPIAPVPAEPVLERLRDALPDAGGP